MVFSSFVFILAFLPVTLLGYYLLTAFNRPYLQKYFLIAASLFFYSYNGLHSLPLLLLSMLVNYTAAKLIYRFEKASRRSLFIVAVIFNILLLGYFKYAGFFVENFNFITGSSLKVDNIILPLGISFFTFQQISYLLSVYKSEQSPESFSDYCLYVTFFPKLIMGPLAEPSRLIAQFGEAARFRFNAENFSSGIYIFCIGLFKKAFIADTIALFVDNGFGLSSPGFTAAWVISLSYTMQIYFDFSGYSDMALGLGRMFNIELPFNFLSPYRSVSIGQFWRRWHITLGHALSSYIYIPLGGSRRGLAHTCLNLFLTFMVSGLWHGASWTFVLWGAAHGLLMVFERIFASQLEKLPHKLRVLGTFFWVNLLWVLFRAESWSQAKAVYTGMFSFGNLAFSQLATIAFDGNINFPNILDYAYVLGLLVCCILVVFLCKNSAEKLRSFKPCKAQLFAAVVMFCLSLLCMTRESVFIYFNF